MMTSDETVIMAYYESIGHVTRLMLRAAQDKDWEMLVEAEACCAQLIGRLEAVKNRAALPPQDTQRKHEILRRVLADDAQIRLLTQPWLRQLDNVLGGVPSPYHFGAVRPQ